MAWEPPPPRRHRRAWLAIAVVIVVVAITVPTVYFVTHNGSAGTGSGSGNGPPAITRIYPGNLTMAYRGPTTGYFGPSTTGFCGNTGNCTPPAGGFLDENASESFLWVISIHNPSNGTHDVDYFLVNSPFVLQSFCYYAYCDAVPIDPGNTTQFDLTIQSPAAAGNYTLNVTLVTEF